MTNNNLNEKLIQAIKISLTENENLVHTIMDILLIGKESTYRRLRGEVPFTFEEVAKISSKLGFSVDNVLGAQNAERAVFDLDLIEPHNLLENYTEKLERNIRLYRQAKKVPHSEARFALNTLPYSFYLPHDNLAKFKLYRWLYQMSGRGAHILYKNMEIPSKVIELQKTFVAESRYIKKAFFILDHNVFTSSIHDIEYFYKLNIINEEDVALIKNDLLEILSDLENIAISGTYKTGAEIQLYLSNVDLEASYAHYEYGERNSIQKEYAHLRVFSINGIDSQNPKVCLKQKEWIESLKRYSTLITQSGEVQRYDYFKKQRKLVNDIIM